MNAKQTLEDVVDYLAPRLDTYEAAIYLYALRHGPLQGAAELVIGFKSARAKMAFGIGEHGKPMSEGTCCGITNAAPDGRSKDRSLRSLPI